MKVGENMLQDKVLDNNDKNVVLDYDAQRIQNFLAKNYYKDSSKRIKMNELASIYNITERQVRAHISNIKLYGNYYVISTKSGYYATDRNNIKDEYLLSRSMNAIERLVSVNPDNLNYYYNKLNSLKKELDENGKIKIS